jgi:hypothetical protein
LEDLGIDMRIILNGSLRSGMGSCGLDCSGLGEGQMAGICECGNEPSVSIKCRKFLDWLRNRQLLKKVSASWS